MRAGSALDSALQRGPPGESLLTGERELDVAERRCAARPRCAQARAGVGIVGVERSQPALGFFFQAFERAAGDGCGMTPSSTS